MIQDHKSWIVLSVNTLIKLTDKNINQIILSIFARMEDNKSKSVQIAEYQRDAILKDMNTFFNGYTKTVMLGTEPRVIKNSIAAEDLVSVTSAELTSPSISS